MKMGKEEGQAGLLKDLREPKELTVEIPESEAIVERHRAWIAHWAHCRRNVLKAKKSGAYSDVGERDLMARTKMQSPEPSEDDAVRVVSRASGGRSKAPFRAAVPQVQRLMLQCGRR